jgi:hypothetical protein
MAASKGHLSVSFRDYKRALASVPYFFNSATGLLVDMLAGAATLIPLIDQVTQAQIVKAQLVIPVTLPGGIKATPDANSDNEDAALLDYSVAGSPNIYGLATPAWIDAGFLAAYPKFVDFADLDVIGYNSFLLTGATGFVPSDRFYNDLTAKISGEFSSRSHRGAVRRAK